MSKILIVDDEPRVVSAFQDLLGDGGHEVATAREAETALELLKAKTFDLVVMDICLLGMNGLEALRRIKKQQPALPVIVMTGHGTMQTAVEATKLGAFDYHLKPFEPVEILAAIDKALESTRLTRTQVVLDPDATTAVAGDALIGRSPGMQQVYKAIGRVAPTDATVLIRGKSGTGKELVARAIHQHSRRADHPLLVVNCVAIPDTLLESELFGYEKGAFTGAAARKPGKFEQASGGTILLDEIGDVSLGIQAKILRVLQERCFEPLGGNQPVEVDVRILAATNRNLERAIAEGTFREDLYHRLNVVTIHVPPLRERREDIPQLVDYFLDRHSRELNVDNPPVSPNAQQLLQDFLWPGNVRQLAHCIQRALIFTRGYPIQAADLALELELSPGSAAVTATWEDGLGELVRRYLAAYSGGRALEEFLARTERLLIAEALRRAGGNQTRAAKLLGLPRPTLHAKMHRHGLPTDTGRRPPKCPFPDGPSTE
jgi:DNA-binding NtrC family response regulator